MIRRGMLMSIPLLAVIAAFSVYGWAATPSGAEVPVHWGLGGLPDRYGSKLEAFLLLPGLALALLGSFALLPAVDPRGQNLRRSGAPFLTGWIGVLAILALAQALVSLTAAGVIAPSFDEGPHGRILTLGLAALFIALGNVMPKARSNWFVGVRTPWSLSSEYAWEKSQRLGGRLLVAVGLAGAVAAFILPWQGALAVVTGGAILAAIASVAMSYVWWRNDPGRTSTE